MFLSIAGLIGFIFLLFSLDIWVNPIPNHDEFRELSQPTIDAIESYKLKNGTYPPTLNEIDNIKSVTVGDYPLMYKSYDAGEEFCVNVGSYVENDFEFSFCSKSGWYFDT